MSGASGSEASGRGSSGGRRWVWPFLIGAFGALAVMGVGAFFLLRESEEAHAGEPVECTMMDSSGGTAGCEAWGTMSEATMIVPLDDMAFTEMDRTGTSVLVYGGPEPMAVGSIVVTETTEGPFYGRVASMNGNEVVTEAASLFDVYPDLDLDVEVEEPDVESAETIAEMDPTPPGEFVDVGEDGGDVIVEGFRGGGGNVRAARPSSAKLECDAEVAATLGVNVQPRLGNFDLKVRGPSNIRAAYLPSLTVGVEASLGGQAECTVTQQLFATRLPSIRFFLGLIPVWIDQQLGVEAVGSVSTSQSITAGMSVTTSAELSVQYRKGRFEAGAKGSARLDRELTIESKFGASLEFPVSYRASLYGLVYVEPRVGPFADLGVQPLEPTWLALDAGLRARVRMGVDLPWPFDDPEWTSPPWDVFKVNLVRLTSNPPTTTTIPPSTTTTVIPETTTTMVDEVVETTAVGTESVPTAPPVSPPPAETAPPAGTAPPTESTPPPGGFVPDVDTYYQLSTIQSRDAGECLEGNQVVDGASLDGAAFMAACQGPSGQTWRFLPEPDGTFRLQTLQLEASGQCLAGGQFGVDGAPAGGAAHMAPCGSAGTQQWTLVPRDNGQFQLRTGAECLEGNRVGADSALGGGAFLSACGDFTGMIWMATPIP